MASSVKSLVIEIIILLIMCMLLCGCTQPMFTWRYIDRTISDDKITSLDLGQVTEGSFFLGSGSIDGETYYYYYKYESDGGFTLQKAPTKFSKIYMDSTPENSHVVISNGDVNPTQCRNDWSDDLCRKEAWVIQKNYVFHIPKGSIKRDYNAML